MAKWNLDAQHEHPLMEEAEADNMDHMMFMGYLEGNCKKYLHRYRYKQKPLEDLRKARWYLDKLVKEMEGE